MPIRWSRLGIPLCLFNRHSPVREEAKWDGMTYTATCKYCRAPIIRRGRSLWKAHPPNRAGR